MPATLKVLGQSAPADTNAADLYTVPSATSAVVSTIHIANTTGTEANASVYIRVAGAAAATSNAFLYSVPVAANSVTAFTEGITLSATDVISVQTGTADALTFMAFGEEIS